MHTDIHGYKVGTIRDAPIVKRRAGNQSTTSRAKIKDVLCAFDIETTRLLPEEQSIMYVWQFAVAGQVIIGRTWGEFDTFIRQLSAELNKDEKLIVWVHNLSFEFVYLRAVHEWENVEIFAMDKRKVAKATWTELNIEFRCSYIHSNMTLDQYTKKMQVEHCKLSGDDFDYSRQRYPWTPLTDLEYEYCENDVLGLCEAVQKEMAIGGDNLYTIPLTSTGYPRRDVKRAIHQDGRYNPLRDIMPDYDIYVMLREAFRGGNTHANRYFVTGITEDLPGEDAEQHILRNVKSADRSSSYPDVMVNCPFPMTPFKPLIPATKERVIRMINQRGKALLMRVAFNNLELRDPYWGCPYISTAQTRRIRGAAYDNGRVLRADYLEMTVTDIDFEIIVNEYECNPVIIEAYYSRYGNLPDSITGTVKEYYRQKTELKDVHGHEVYYTKLKNLLNSLYGMMATNPVRMPIEYSAGDWKEGEADPRELYNDYLRKGFLAYQHGVWVTAWARLRLEQGIRLAHGLHIDGSAINWKRRPGKKPPHFVYCDTDSVKYLGDVDWSEFNDRAVRAAQKSGSYATDIHGVVHFTGVFEEETSYYFFSTMGAKKYAYTFSQTDHTHVTIAGVTKKKGGLELDNIAARHRLRRIKRRISGRRSAEAMHGKPFRRFFGLEFFRDGTTFYDAGGLEAVYNDHPPMDYVEREGRKIYITPNINLRPSTYTLGLTAEYKRLLAGCGDSWVFDIDK